MKNYSIKQQGKVFLSLLILAFSIPVFAQPVNDNPENAIVMSVSTDNWASMYRADFSYATESYASSCEPSHGDDVWFRFIANSPDYSIYTETLTNVHAEVFSNLTEDPIICTGVQNLKDTLHDLVVGNTYYLRLYNPTSSDTKSNLLYFYLVKVAKVQHENCSSAKTILIDDNAVTVRDTIFFPEANAINCTGSIIENHWYSFTAKHYRYDFVCPRGFYYQIYENCENNPLVCESSERIGSGYTTINRRYKLEPGKVYFVQVYNSYTTRPDASYLTIKPVATNPDIPNDVCSGAISLPVGQDYQYTTLPVASFCGQTLTGCTESGLVDCWYKFQASSSVHGIAITPQSASYIPHGFSIYESCTAREPIACFEGYEGFPDNLTPGKEYYVKANNMLYNNYTLNTFSLLQIGVKALGDPPVNNNCSSPTFLPIENGTTGLIQGTLSNATLSGGNNCINPSADIWYTFKAESPVHFIYLRGKKIAYEVYSSCNDSEPLICSKVALSKLENLQPGSTYYLRIIKTDVRNTEFSFSIDTQSNTNCHTPESLTPSISENYTAHSISSGFNEYGVCNGRFTAWFTFTANSTSYVLKGLSEKKLLYVLKPVCDTTFYRGCTEITAAPALLTQLEEGQSYLLGIALQNFYGFAFTDTNTIGFKLSLQEFPNDECDGAISLANDIEYGGNSMAGTASPTICQEAGGRNDLWYKFSPQATATRIVIQGKTQAASYELLEESCAGKVVYCVGTNSKNYSDVFNLDTTKTYYLRVSAYGEFSVKATDILNTVTGDICSSATEIPVRDEIHFYSPDFTNAGYEHQPCVTYYGYNQSVWYKFQPQSANISLLIQTTDAFVEVFDDCSLNNSILCKQLNSYYTSIFRERLILDSSMYYFIRITPINNTVSLKLAIQNEAENDDCSNATEISVHENSDTIKTNIVNATSSGKNTCNNGYYKDLWYKFTTTSEWLEVNYNSTGNISFEILSDCQATSSFYCEKTYQTSGRIHIPGLNKNQLYYLRFFTNTGNTDTSSKALNFAIRNIPAPANDDCANAIPILPSDTGFAYTEHVLSGATSNAGNGIYNSPDVWFSLVSQDPYITLKYQITGNISVNFEIKDSCNENSNRNLYNGNPVKVVPGKKYYIRAWWSRSYSYTNDLKVNVAIKSHVAPVNDVCTQALTLVPSKGLPEFQNINLLNAGTEARNCYTTVYDIWYQFTSSSNSTTIRLRKPSPYTGFSLYSACGSTTHLFCKSDTLYTFTSEPGKTYFLTVYSTQSTIDKNLPGQIAIVENDPIDNLTCATARQVSVSKNECIKTGVDFQTVPVGSSSNYKEVWYKFVAEDSMQMVQVNSGNPAIEYYLYESCGGKLISVTSEIAINKYNYRFKYASFNPGLEYFIHIRYPVNSERTERPETSFCISGAYAKNDECSEALDLTDSCNVSKWLDIFPTTRSANPSCESIGSNHSDAWFKFTTDEVSDVYALELSSNSYNSSDISGSYFIEISESCASPSRRCISGEQIISNNYFSSNPYEYLFDSLKTKTTYFVRIINKPYQSTDYSSPYKTEYKFLRSSGPDLKEPYWTNQIIDNCVFYEPCDKTSSGSIDSHGSTLGFYDNWYSFQAKDTLVRFVLDNNFFYELYSGSYQPYLPQSLNSFYESPLKDTLVVRDVKLDTTKVYQLRIAARNEYSKYTSYPYQVCMYNIGKTMSNNTCADPVLLNSDMWYHSELQHSIPYYSNCLADSIYSEKWFEIQSGEGYINLIVEDNAYDIEIYDSCDSLLECYQQENNTNNVSMYLEPNRTYLVKVSGRISYTDTGFKIYAGQTITANKDITSTDVIQVYPNPAGDILNINGVEDNTPASIISADGHLISSFKIRDGKIPTDFLNPGFFILDLGNKKIKFTIAR